MDASKLKEFRDGVHAVQDCISNLNKWEKEIKKEDERLLALSKQNHTLDASEEYPIRSKASASIASDVADNSKQKDDSKKPLNGKTKINAYDYAAWDKYDADAEVKKIDEVKIDKASSEQKKRSSPAPSDAGAPAARQKQRKKGATGACPASTDEDKIKALKLKDEGNSLFSAGKYQDAVNTYTLGIELDASNHILHANRAMAYIKLNEGRAAERDCDACIAQAPNYLKAYLRRGVARLMQGKLRLALLDYNEVLQVEPWNKEAKAQMAEIQRKLSAGAEPSQQRIDEPSQQRTDDAGHGQSTPNALQARSRKSLQKLEVIEVNKESEIPPFILPKPQAPSSSDSRRFAPVNKTQTTTRLPKQTSESSTASSSSIQNAGSAPDRSSSPSNITVNSHEKQPKSPQDSSALKNSNKAEDSQMNIAQSSSNATQSSTSPTHSHTSPTQPSTSTTQPSVSPTHSQTVPTQSPTSRTQSSTSTTQPSTRTTTQPFTSDLQVSEQTMVKPAVAPSCASLPPVPRTSHQFMAAWSKVTAASHDSAISWLKGVKPSLLHKFELETECVASVVHHLLVWRKALSAEQNTAELSLVHDYVLAFANSRGFDLQILFLEDQQKRDLLELWELLKTSNTSLPRKLEEMKEAISTL